MRSNAARCHVPAKVRSRRVGAALRVVGRFLVVGAGLALLARGTGLVTAQNATPEAIVPAPTECTVQPRSLASLRALSEASGGARRTPLPPDGFALPPGLPADAVTTAAIGDALRELIACLNARDEPRIYALYSDGYLRPLIAGRSFDESAGATPIGPVAMPREAWTTIQVMREVRVLTDGRAACLALIHTPEGAADLLVVFVKVGDRWLVDELAQRLAKEDTRDDPRRRR
jgi:hypothetical protein